MYLTSPPDHSSGHNTVNSKCKCNQAKYMHILFLFSWFNRLTYCWKKLYSCGPRKHKCHPFCCPEPVCTEKGFARWQNSFWGCLIIRTSMHARQLILSLPPAWQNGSAEGKTGQKTKLYTPGNHCAPWGGGNKVVIQSTLTGKVTNQLKGQLWQDIAVKVSNCGVCLQNSDQVREKFSDIKEIIFHQREKKTGNWRQSSSQGETIWWTTDVHHWKSLLCSLACGVSVWCFTSF